MPILEAVDLYRFYHAGEEETLALRGVSMRLDAGEMVAVMGPSGSGKSTLLACLAGLDEPDGGHVELMRQRLTRRPEPERAALRASHIGILLQSGNLFDHLSVADNVRVQMRLAHNSDEKRLDNLLASVGLSGRRHALPTQLSGGEAARAGLAVALAASPPVLLADEPTGEVDAETEQEILRLFAQRSRDGGATLVVTHSEALAANADRIVRLRDGRITDE
ncbi:MAG: ABC transporter ATP-binding protein [Chloroflexota bacterium]|nr:ABC transporter ATP-binding protein [Chloroflexota bacterium]